MVPDLPRIGRDLPRLWFGVLEGQSYVYNAYLLTLSALLILAGALSDVFGRRRMFLWGLAGFGITSVLCGLAPNMELLVLFRVLQGVAGAVRAEAVQGVPRLLAVRTTGFDVHNAHTNQRSGRDRRYRELRTED